ncbi:aspartyl-phosphate phosphatase Spo0E family protein [Crassaminicella thermophila]|uniref:Aspartyl-phosphate phosphatase Spo0E family protein n=1 Tax=Crassaminicella thermophila TaxID=2599308 RepID=A0A5C0SE29_CRATE|nr:aspartyl-phosphate phosphatase Spo0E family protein [Crassaminicella thermophila]QEK11209.1 aspartyl-phosphate phosphatase Spo0E family protein [Crassaminicella thermophila]
MSQNELKKKIEEMNIELSALLKNKYYNLQDYAVLEYSQKLDVLIVAYMQSVSKH